MNNLSNHYNPIRGVWCFSYSLSSMALSEWEFMLDDDPWKVSALVSAVVELFLSILLLLGAVIAFFTSRFAKICGLEPPCTYIGCSHPLHGESLRGQMLPTPPSCKAKDLCRGDFCSDCRPLRIHSKSHLSCASIQEEGSDAFDLSDHNARERDADDNNGNEGCHERRCSCSNNPWNHLRGAKHTTFIHTASTSNLTKDDNLFRLSRSGSESIEGFDAKDHFEISQAPVDSEEEWAWKGISVRREKNIESYVILALDREALERSGDPEHFNEKSHGMSPSLLERSQEESTEKLPLYAVHNEVEELRVSKNDCEHCKQEDDGLVNIAIRLVRGTCFNVSESEKVTRQSRVLMSKDHLEATDQKVDDADCLQKGLVAVHSSSSEWSSLETIVEGLQKASLDGADVICEMNGRVLEGEEAGLLMQDPGKGVKHVSDDAMAVKDERVFTNALANCGESSEHAQERALSEDNEKEIITEEKEEEKEEEGLDSLKLDLQAERSVLAALEAELENERNAAAVATSEAMAMISRLQDEKSALQVKVTQLQRMSEEKAEYDEEAIGLLKEILYKRETENFALEKEVELYRETLSDELNKRSWLREEIESSLPQSLKPLLLTGGEEVLSPVEDMKHKQGSAFPERGYQPGIKSAPLIRQHGPNPDLEELNAFSLDQNVNKRPRDFPMNDLEASMSLRVWDEEGRPRYHVDGDLHGTYYNSEQLKKTGRSVFSMNDEESLSSVLERLWVLEEGLQKLCGKDSAGSQSKAHGAQQLAFSSTPRGEDKSLTDTWGGQNGCGIESKEQGEVEIEGVAEGFVPIHDVYEVQSSSNRSPPFAEERDLPQGFEGLSGNLELPPGGTPEILSRARMAKHRIPISPRFSPAKKLFLSDEAPSTPVFTPPAAGWIVGKSSHPEDVCDPQDLQAQSVGLREERGTTKEGIQQFEMRLKMLEEDRELWKESLESFTHRDAELDLLQEIAQHLRELRMVGFMKLSGGAFSEDVVTATSPIKNRPVKKRRYCVGSGQAQMPLLYQKSV